MEDLRILQETDQWLVIDKPAGVSVHNENPNVLTLLQALRPGQSFHLAHRLDLETSGLLLLAKNPRMAATLMQALQEADAQKKYQALLRGTLDASEASWTWPLTDKAEGRKNPQGMSKDRKPCETRLRVLNSNRYFTWVECEILTGRQHQIRKHAALARHPLVGDPRYNDPAYNSRMKELYGTGRLFLHAFELRLRIADKHLIFHSNPPEDFSRLLRS